MFKYPVRLEAEPEGGFVVSFRDIPEALSQGDTREEALQMAEEALVTAMDFYFEDHRPVPLPSKAKRGEVLVALPPSLAAKVALLNLMLEKRVRPADLARTMHVKPQEVTRIMDLHHATKIDTISAAFAALNYELVFDVKAAAHA